MTPVREYTVFNFYKETNLDLLTYTYINMHSRVARTMANKMVVLRI